MRIKSVHLRFKKKKKYFTFKLLVKERFKSSSCFLGVNMLEVWMLLWVECYSCYPHLSI